MISQTQKNRQSITDLFHLLRIAWKKTRSILQLKSYPRTMTCPPLEILKLHYARLNCKR